MKTNKGRLDALARAHSLLVEARWEGAEFAALVRSQLGAYLTDDPRRLVFEGDAVMIPPDFATPFGLVLHELATNAAKYGALSAGTGQVLLSWGVQRESSHRRFMVRWRETGGPPVVEPERVGFGGTLIERGLPGAVVQREFAREGLTCTIELELPEDQHNGERG